MKSFRAAHRLPVLARTLAIAVIGVVPLSSSADYNYSNTGNGSSSSGQGSSGSGNAATGTTSNSPIRQIIIPARDQFTPFGMTVRVGQTVEWVNQDTDAHTVVSDDAFNTVGRKFIRLDQLLPGTDSTGGVPSTFRLRFNRPGTFVYSCRFHSQPDASGQPKAPGPDGGIQDGNGNYGTPMMGVITVLPKQ